MYRAFGAPELQREEEAIDVLCVRVGRLRRRVMRVVVTLALLAAFGVLALAAGLSTPHGPFVTDKVLGLVFASALFGALFGGHAVGARLTGRCAERWALALARERRCDAEPLVDAARLLAGGVR